MILGQRKSLNTRDAILALTMFLIAAAFVVLMLISNRLTLDDKSWSCRCGYGPCGCPMITLPPYDGRMTLPTFAAPPMPPEYVPCFGGAISPCGSNPTAVPIPPTPAPPPTTGPLATAAP